MYWYNHASEVLDVYGNIQVSSGSAYKYNGVNIAYGSTTLNNYFFGGAGNPTMTGTGNIASGLNALASNTTGVVNTAIGTGALGSNTTGRINTAVGAGALSFNLSGESNAAVGVYSLFSNTTGNYNVSLGYDALFSNTTGSNNVAVGQGAGYLSASGVSGDYHSMVDNNMLFLVIMPPAMPTLLILFLSLMAPLSAIILKLEDPI